MYVQERWLPSVNAVKDKYEFDLWHFAEIAEDIRDVRNNLHAIIESIEPEAELQEI